VSDTESLRDAEERFQAAQLASDVGELDLLLHPDLVFVGPDGSIGNKGSDLDAHRTGLMHLDTLEPEDLIVRVSSGVGVTILTARMSGNFASQGFSARMRYTRCWAWGPKGWKIVAAHISMIDSL
jgi:ketosteroid isomerase-like protein